MRKKLGLFLVSILLSQALVASASESSLSDAKEMASNYEGNIIFSVTGGYWEFPTKDTEFLPDDAIGLYEKPELTEEAEVKWANYNEVISKIGVMDSPYTYEDAYQFELTPDEKLSLSTVTFSYYYDYRDGSLVQYYQIDWVDTTKTQGYVVWKDNVVFEYRRLS